jgi:hypothetical protein
MRKPGWPRLLNEFLIAAQDRYRRVGFTWGREDCIHFAGDWVQRLTGDDPIADYRGRYSTAAEAFALLAELDGTLYDALVKRFGDPVHPAKAMRGDLAYIAPDKCGIMFTSGARMMGLFLGEGGFVLHRARDIDHAFRVE